MNQEPRIDILAAALADRARSRMVAALMDGCAYSAKELAFRAEVTPQTASFHLRRLTESGVLEGYRRGRHHYFHIGDPDIAAAVEALMAAAPQAHLRNLPPRAKGDFVLARSCWTHLAGKLAVALAARLTELDALAFRGGTFVPGRRRRHCCPGSACRRAGGDRPGHRAVPCPTLGEALPGLDRAPLPPGRPWGGACWSGSWPRAG